MRLTTKGRYAVTAMLDLALSGESEPVTAAEISKRQKIPLPYLEQLFRKLRHDHLVESIHGPGGGYRLARMPEEISIADIIQAVDEPVDATQCHGKLNCHAGQRCMTHDLWAHLNLEINRYLASVMLSHLTASQREQTATPVHLGIPIRVHHSATKGIRS
jgi:Rrf2 family iron-sulfur cluster assembly transcriptional regulator